MPEGDSVWLLARRLDRALLTRHVSSSQFRVPQLATADVTGRSILEHHTHGKHLLTRFSGGLTLHSHLMMDGRWQVTRPGRRLPSATMHEVRLIMTLDSGETVWGRRLHQLRLVPTSAESRLIGHLGPDLLHADFDADEARRRLSSDPERPLVAALLDQRAVAGLGNLWVNELAFWARTSPWTPIGQVDLAALLTEAQRALRRSATVPGAYQNTTGRRERGETHWVSGRQFRPCLRCRTIVAMVDDHGSDPDQRRTWWCPTCQPGPVPAHRQVLRPRRQGRRR